MLFQRALRSCLSITVAILLQMVDIARCENGSARVLVCVYVGVCMCVCICACGCVIVSEELMSRRLTVVLLRAAE